jgi:hypothetical protein
VEVEAMVFTPDSYEAVRQWMGEPFVRIAAMNGGVTAIRIRTLEGVMTVSNGDWIVRGIRGEFYPVKPDIFAQTYEAVDD